MTNERDELDDYDPALDSYLSWREWVELCRKEHELRETRE